MSKHIAIIALCCLFSVSLHSAAESIDVSSAIENVEPQTHIEYIEKPDETNNENELWEKYVTSYTKQEATEKLEEIYAEEMEAERLIKEAELKAEQERLAEEARQRAAKAYAETVQADTLNPFEITNYSAEEFDKLLVGTPMTGCGIYIVELEKTYGVNGIFCLAVAKAESSLGESYIARNNTNYFGIMGNGTAMTYESPEQCIMAFGSLMNGSLYYGKTIDQIAPIYCDSYWATLVRRCIDSLC